MTQFDLFDVDVLQVPGRYWLSLSEMEDAHQMINRLAKSANHRQPGSLAVLEVKPVLINNLRAWENLVLPYWYHHAGSLHEHDEYLMQLLDRMEFDVDKMVQMMSKLPGQLDWPQRRVVALLRAIMQRATMWVLEEEWLDWWHDGRGRNPLLAQMYAHIELPPSLLVISTRPARAAFQSIHLQVDASV